ncbi:MAG TPA: serine/threonine-protein kinase, partial [Kineosporiaceae bacterium]
MIPAGPDSPAVDPLTERDPVRMGRYVLQGRLGSGGMGTVFLGRSPSGRAVAVKTIHPHLARDPQFRARFAREVAAAVRVNGFYTAQVVDADADAPVPWMATRFIDGPSLTQRVATDGPLPPPEVFRLAAGIAEALVCIHAEGLVHRDLKPSNVVLAAEGPQVIDFGIARVVEPGALTTDDGTLTGTGGVVGTFEYMSPEQAAGEPVTTATDVFSLGGLLHFAATGRPAFGSGHPL